MMTIRARLILPSPPLVERFRSPRPIERVGMLAVRNYGPPPIPDRYPVRYRFAQVIVPGCKAGDLIEAQFDMQVSNKLSYVVELAWALCLTQDAAAFDGVRLSGASNAINVTPQTHHQPVEENASIRIPSDGDWYVIAMVYAGGGSQSLPGDLMNVDCGYGSFEITRTRDSR